jgi:hypothetical protein
VFDVTRSDAERAAHLEDGDRLAPLLAWAHERYPSAGGARVDRVRFLDDDLALVHYAIELGATHLPQSGWARRHPTGWKVTRDTYATLLRQAGLPTP